ncbi:MAG: hypothetical protein Ct9H90mP6_06760 [Gammaproteobacteria bacterium]|nr:MAG: hypothetical protein Ct9H90mP6_06760 [Gammaproteobacteria bacterium]
MTIKSDKWIRKMAIDQGMIEPFQEDQIRYSDAIQDLYHMAFLVMGMTLGVQMNLKYLLIFIQQ